MQKRTKYNLLKEPEILFVRMKCFLFGLLAFVSCVQFGQATYKLQERFNWKQLDFAFPNENLKQQALASGDYIPQNALPVGVEHWQNRLFVTVPRWRDGKFFFRSLNRFEGLC